MVTDRPIYEFDGVRVDVGRMAAVRGNTAIPLEPKAFDVLIFLIERRDRVVTKEELLDAVWRDTFVTPNPLTRAVAQIRKGLGDEAGDAWNIYTVSRTTRTTSALTAFTSGSGYVRFPTWSPLGTRIVFERAMESASVWTMTLPSGQ